MKHIELHSIFFFLVFPGYLFYHAVRPSLLPNQGIGWFSLVLITSVLYYSWLNASQAIIRRTVNLRALSFTAPTYALIISMSWTVMTKHMFPLPYQNNDGLIFSVQIIITTLGMFYLGRHLVDTKIWKRSGPFAMCTFVYLLLVIILYDPTSGVMTIPPGLDEDGDLAYILSANYQGIARSIMYTGLLVIPFLKGRSIKIGALIIYLTFLYFTGSRTDFLLLLAIVPFFIYIHFGILRFSIFSLIFSLILAAALLWLDSSRLSVEGAEQSLSERHVFLVSGIERIVNSPFGGDYLGQVREFGDLGSYIHNALSMWSQFGLFAFLLYSALIVGTLYYSVTLLLKRATGASEVLFYLAFTSFLGVLLSRSITWPIPALAWGLAASILSENSRICEHPLHTPLRGCSKKSGPRIARRFTVATGHRLRQCKLHKVHQKYHPH